MKQRRGVADVIAALVLIFITIIAAGVVFVIATNYAGRLSNNVGVQITSSQITPLPGGGAVLQVTVQNTGTVPEGISVSTSDPQTFEMGSLNMDAYAYYWSNSQTWNPSYYFPYPYTGSVPSGYVSSTTNWAPPYAYGTRSYVGQNYLGMVVVPFPYPFTVLDVGVGGFGTQGYIATGSFFVPQTTQYTFYAVTDDATAIWINGPSTNGQWIEVFNGAAWHPQGAGYVYTANENLQPGVYQIAIEWLNLGGPGMSAIKITPQPASLIQPGQTVSGTFVLNGNYAVGQSVTLTATAYSASGTATTATIVLVS